MRATRVVLAFGALVELALLAVLASVLQAPLWPMRPLRFARDGAELSPERLEALSCSGPIGYEGDVAWQTCSDVDADETLVARIDLPRARATLVGPVDARSLRGAVPSGDGGIVALIGASIVEVRERGVHVLGNFPGPVLGMARVGRAIEVVASEGAPEVTSFEGGRRESRALPGPVSDETTRRYPTMAWHDGSEWHVLWLVYPQRIESLPVEVALVDRREDGSERTLGTEPMGAPEAHLSDGGGVFVDPGWVVGGAVLHGGVHHGMFRVLRGDALERVAREGARLEVVAFAVGGGGTVLADGGAERVAWLEGEWASWPEVEPEARGLRVGERTGPAVVRAGRRDVPADPVTPLPAPDGGRWLVGPESRSVARLDAELRRADAPELAERAAIVAGAGDSRTLVGALALIGWPLLVLGAAALTARRARALRA